MSIEVRREVQVRFGKQSVGAQLEHQQQSTESSVAVTERVDRLELVVNERDIDERWVVLHLEVPEHLVQKQRDVIRIRGDEVGRLYLTIVPDDDRSLSYLSRALVLTAHVDEE